jgi:hypothetical protein
LGIRCGFCVENEKQDLLKQIDSLKCCGNCKMWNIHDFFDGYCDHPESEMPDIVRKRTDKCDKWEQA